MTQQVGSIEYTIGADTSDLLVAEKQVDTSTNKIADDFNKVSKSTTQLQTSVKKSAVAVNRSLNGLGRNAGQAGIQIQQLVGQIQGGQNVFQAFSAQATDLGIVLGAPLVGVIIGLGSAIAGTLLPTLFDSEDALLSNKEAADELIKRLDDLTEAEKRVAIASANRQIKEQEEAIKSLSDQLREARFEAISSFGLFSDIFGDTAEEEADKVANIEENLALAQARLREFRQDLERAKSAGGVTDEELADQLAKSQDQYSKELGLFLSKLKSEEQLESESFKRRQDAASKFANVVTLQGDSPEERLQRQLDKVEELYQQGLLSQQLYDNARVSIAKQANELIEKDGEKTVRNELARQSLLLTSVSSLFDSLAGLAGQFEGEQSDTFRALFAISKGFAIANAGLNLSTALSQVLADPTALTPAQKFANYASVFGAGTQLISAISSATYAGGRANGGPVSGGSTYRLGENNQPEILQTSAGMFGIPGDQGRVFNRNQLEQIESNSNMMVNVIVENNAPSAAVSVNQSDDGRTVRIAVNEVARQIREGQGPIAQSLRQNTTTQLRGGR